MSFYIKKKNILVSWNEWFSNWIYWILDHFSPSLRNFLNVRIFTLETGPRGNIKFWKTFVANSSSLDISAIVARINTHSGILKAFFEFFQVNFWCLKYFECFFLFRVDCSALTGFLRQQLESQSGWKAEHRQRRCNRINQFSVGTLNWCIEL